MLRLAELRTALAMVQDQLVAASGAEGHWHGRLSSSALATAVAVVALSRNESDAERVGAGIRWLESSVNRDGGWGDSPESPSNLSTTLLVWSALGALSQHAPTSPAVENGARMWLSSELGNLDPATLVRRVLAAYGADRSFSIPILTMAALCGRLEARWREIPQLPFELAALPQCVFRWLNLPVVSYAVPALVALGMLRHRRAPSRVLPLRWLRNALTPMLLNRLDAIQPTSGGYLEAIPLTGFVVTSLAACGYSEHQVTRRGVDFLRRGQRADGSWPIDSNLSIWVSTRAVEALLPDPARGDAVRNALPSAQRAALHNWLMAQQSDRRHPFTGAAAGGWCWTDAPGGVPDADDTAGALIALYRLGTIDAASRDAAACGVAWLLDLQNSDGGMPTFCRGWARLPFDCSCPDLTAHALRAWSVWRGELANGLQWRVDRAVRRGIEYLASCQTPEGSWSPLWFGSQHREDHGNPVYGTALVVDALTRPEVAWLPGVFDMRARAESWLLSVQNPDGGWGGDGGGPSSIEETALALSSLAPRADLRVVERAAQWLSTRVTAGSLEPSPIGLYFARLWYSEALYPIAFTARALRRAMHRLGREQRHLLPALTVAPWTAAKRHGRREHAISGGGV